MKTIFIVIAVLVVAGIGGYAYMNHNSQSANVGENVMPTESESPSPVVSESPSMSPEASVSVSPSVSSMSQTKEFTVIGTSFKFSPAEIRVKKGDNVKIIFKNDGGMHDWVLDEFNVRTNRIKSGQTETVEFTADKTGTFEYYCSVGTHRQMGMKGNLIVE